MKCIKKKKGQKMKVIVLEHPMNSDWLKAKQRALVNMIVDINADSLMQIMNKRLCGCATKEMQELMLMIREEVIKTNPEFKQFLIPMCEYLHSCNEFRSCGKKALYFERGIK